MTDLNKQELRRLAEMASPAYEWYAPCDLRYADDKTGEVHGLNHDDDSFISAANPAAILSLLDEVEALRKEAERYRDALAHVAAQVDGNIREAVRDCVNFIGDVQDIYGYCDQIDEIIDTAIDPDLAGEGNANG